MKKIMKRILIFLGSVGILLFMVSFILVPGCDISIYHWEFDQEPSEIVGLYVVNATSPQDYRVVKSIPLDRKEELLQDITALEYKKYGYNLHNTHGLCFVIKFQNGAYDIISYCEPMHVRNRRNAEISWLECDMEQFNELINKYLEP